MKNLKKLIALVAVLALTLSTVALGATYTDVADDSAYSTAVESLSKLNIVTGYEDGTYAPEKAVTRAEMATLIARIQGYDDTASAQTATVFTDVPAEYWASGYVAAASNMGIVNGYGDGTFGPDDTVKYEQAVTMIMRTLGYEPFAAANGGYPTGYLAAAQRYGLTKNVSNAVSGTDANRGTIAQLLYNGIDTPIMGQSKWSTDGTIEYTIYDGKSATYKTLMSENLGVVKVKGVVTANIATVIGGTTTIDTEQDETVTLRLTDVYKTTDSNFYTNYGTETQARKATMPFFVNNTEIADAIGYSVVAYVVEDEVKADQYNVVSFAKDSATNNTVEFTLDQYAGFDVANEEIDYYKNATDNDTTALKLEAANIPVIYNFNGNNIASSVFGNVGGSEPVIPDTARSGKVTLIDNDTTYGYDYAIVEVSASKVVNKATADKVSFKGSGSLEVDYDATDRIIKLTKDGEAIAHTDLVEWDVVTVVASNSDLSEAKYIVAEVIGSTLVGKVEATKSSDTSLGGNAYRIEGTYYDVAVGASSVTGLKIGEGGTFYVDKYGKIVAFNEDATLVGGTAGTYAYVITGGLGTAFGAKYGQMRLLTANGIDIYDIADEVSFNDGAEISVDSVGEIYTHLFPLDLNDDGVIDATDAGIAAATNTRNILGTMILYNTNSDGEIDEIWTAGNAGEIDANVAGVEFEAAGAINNKWDADNFNLGGEVDEDAVVFLLTGLTNQKDSKVGTIADLEDNVAYTGLRFKDARGEIANLILITSGYGTAGSSSNVAVVTEFAEEVNDEGDKVYYISYLQDGEEKAAYTSAYVYDNLYNGFTIGDIVKVKLTDGVITTLTSVVNLDEAVRNNIASKASAITGAETGTDTEEFWYFDIASVATESSTAVTIDGVSMRLDRAENVYVINPNGKNTTIKVGDAYNYSFLDAEDKGIEGLEDYVFIRKYNGGIKDVVIIKGKKKADLKDAIAVWDNYKKAVNNMLSITGLAATDNLTTVTADADYIGLTTTDANGNPVVNPAKTAYDKAVTAVASASPSTVQDVLDAIAAGRLAVK